jgi:peptidoglycan/LPS O-acetylase OafA/YrhL
MVSRSSARSAKSKARADNGRRECKALPPAPPYRFAEFDALRGLLALWVLVGHVLLTFADSDAIPNAAVRLLCDNTRAVNVFMAMSGFVICFLLERERERYGPYLARRFFRLYPAYIACFLASIAFAAVAIEVLHGFSTGTRGVSVRIDILHASRAHLWEHVATHLGMVHGLVPPHVLPYSEFAFLGQAWSISVEWQFYVIAPVIWFLVKPPFSPKRLIGLAALVAALRFGSKWFGSAYIGSYELAFGVGIASFLLWEHRGRAPQWLIRHSSSVAMAVSVLWIIVLPRRWEFAIWLLVFLSSACGAMAAARVTQPDLPSRALHALFTSRALLWLGRVSYSVYLSHLLVLYVVLWALQSSGSRSFVNAPVVAAMTVAGSLALSQILYSAVERPFIDFARSGYRRIYGISFAGAATAFSTLGVDRDRERFRLHDGWTPLLERALDAHVEEKRQPERERDVDEKRESGDDPRGVGEARRRADEQL